MGANGRMGTCDGMLSVTNEIIINSKGNLRFEIEKTIELKV